MNPFLPLRSILLLVALTLYFVPRTLAQCNVNSQYDKIVSGYHSSIAQKTDGSFATWGAGMSKTGGDLGSPTALDSTVYTAITGTPLKVAIGGQGASGGTQDQAILLTTNGLWAWAAEGMVVANSLTTSTSIQRFTPSGATTLGLPTGLTPSDVAELFASYQTLIIVTKITGNVWVLTQANKALEGNGTTASGGTGSWQKVKTNSSTYLSGVTAVRGQVSSGTVNALMAVTSSGTVYTWGNTVFLGDATAAQTKNYATVMTLPSEFSSSVPKMIAVTGGNLDATTSVVNTYYVLANSGKLYSLGDNRYHQLGDFSVVTTSTSWVQAKKTSGTTFTDVNFISAQEADAAYPGVAVITTGGDLYTWGDDNSGMLGRATSGVASGAYDPGIPNNFTSGTDKAVFCEMGGHTLVYVKVGSTRFCYAGHKTNGSMGDGTTTSTSPTATLTYDCSATPVISICGYVPTTPSATTSAITADQYTLVGNGSSTTYVRIQLKDASGNNLTTSGGVVILSSTVGTLSSVTDNNDGTYTALLTSPLTATATSTTISYTINGTTGVNTVNISFTASGLLPVIWKSYRANRVGKAVTVAWSTIEDNHVAYYRVERSLDGISWRSVGSKITAQLLPNTNYYTQTDGEYIASQVYYRIQQVDKDGNNMYSPILEIGPDGATSTESLTVYPFPATASFKLGNTIPDKVSKVSVYNMNGSLVKSWNSPQSEYGIGELAKGMYLLKVELKVGGTKQLRLSKN